MAGASELGWILHRPKWPFNRTEEIRVKRSTVILAGILLAVVASVVFWQHFHTGLHAAVAQVAEPKMAATATNSVPAPMNKSTDGNQASGDPAQLTYDDERRRLDKAVLERYYPDLQKETGFTTG